MKMVKMGGDTVIEELDRRKYGALHRRCIERDFARNERRPLFLIRRLHERGMYDFLALRDDATGRLLAYAGLLHAQDVDSMLLDYPGGGARIQRQGRGQPVYAGADRALQGRRHPDRMRDASAGIRMQWNRPPGKDGSPST